MMVGLTYFFDHEKDVHWIAFLEKAMSRFATIKGVEIVDRPDPRACLLVTAEATKKRRSSSIRRSTDF